MPRIPYRAVEDRLTGVLAALGFDGDHARLCGRLFAETSRDGVYSHGLNRFPRFVEQIRQGIVDPKARAAPVGALAAGSMAIERWDGHGGPGNLNALACMDRALALSRRHGLGCVALANTNHWMRGGTYGWQAVEAGAIGICWTNTMANLPAWGAPEPRVGNNPLVIAVPHADGPVVLDMAMSQFSFGALESYRLRGESLPVDGGFDRDGNLTRDPAAIEASGRALPIGSWKGSGLAMMLDLLAALLSGGLATHQIPFDVIRESRLSQVFLAFDLAALDAAGQREAVVRGVLDSVRGPAGTQRLRTPGERIARTRRENLDLGIPIDDQVWQRICELGGTTP
jgi:3-dehydro-L-gulonate 2-dehydrogenase